MAVGVDIRNSILALWGATQRGAEAIPLSMKRTRRSMTALLGVALMVSPAFLVPGAAMAQTAKQDMKNAGHDTKNGAEDAGRGVKKGTKKGYHKTKRGTKKAWHKTKNTTKGAVRGGENGAKRPD
jgi:hypothetical protein